MRSKNIIQVWEYEKLYYDEAKPFQQKHWEALCRYLQNEKNEVPLFRIINKGIQFTNYVGVIQAGNLTIEVLPKTDKRVSTADNEDVNKIGDESKKQWQRALLQMLQECQFLNIHHVDYANLKLRNYSILEVYIELFLAEAERLVHEGLLKKYSQKEGNQSALKGQILFGKQAAKNSIHQERFYVRSSAYEVDNIYNQILRQTLQLIHTVSNSNHLSDKAGRLLQAFPELTSLAITAATFKGLSYDRKTERYKEAIEIARMLLLNYRPDITGGNENIIAILFDMNALWEEWVYCRLKKEETAFSITVQRQQSTSFWDAAHLSKPKTIRPDIVIQNKEQTIILDTKWKLIEGNTPNDEDLKQMFVYNLYWQCSESILLYPANEEKAPVSGSYKAFAGMGNTPLKCLVMAQSVFEENKLAEKFGGKILSIILKENV